MRVESTGRIETNWVFSRLVRLVVGELIELIAGRLVRLVGELIVRKGLPDLQISVLRVLQSAAMTACDSSG